MRKKENFIFTFVVFFLLSALVLFLVKNGSLRGLEAVLESVLMPLQKLTQDISGLPQSLFSNREVEKLKAENQLFLSKIVNQKELEKENNALRDQFQTAKITSKYLMPASIIGMPSFIPKVSNVEYYVLDKGEKNGVKVGQAVIYKDFVVGRVTKALPFLSIVNLITNKASSFTAKTMETNALGVIKGQSNQEMIFDNVLLSDDLKLNDQILTKGDIDLNGIGFMPNLVVGKIISIDKKASALFQKAVVKSAIDFSSLSTVFIVTDYKSK